MLAPETDAMEFSDLFTQRDKLYRAVALSIGDQSVAAEAVDEAMTRAYEQWHEVSGYENPEGWVYRVALNWARSVFRKRRMEDLWSEPPDRPGEEDRTSDHALRTAVGRLPLRIRSVVVARYLLDWSTTRTAAALGIPESTVKTRLRKALTRLANDLGEANENS